MFDLIDFIRTKSGQQLGLINANFDLVKLGPKSSQTK
jgi:hypothetical protein